MAITINYGNPNWRRQLDAQMQQGASNVERNQTTQQRRQSNARRSSGRRITNKSTPSQPVQETTNNVKETVNNEILSTTSVSNNKTEGQLLLERNPALYGKSNYVTGTDQYGIPNSGTPGIANAPPASSYGGYTYGTGAPSQLNASSQGAINTAIQNNPGANADVIIRESHRIQHSELDKMEGGSPLLTLIEANPLTGLVGNMLGLEHPNITLTEKNINTQLNKQWYIGKDEEGKKQYAYATRELVLYGYNPNGRIQYNYIINEINANKDYIRDAIGIYKGNIEYIKGLNPDEINANINEANKTIDYLSGLSSNKNVNLIENGIETQYSRDVAIEKFKTYISDLNKESEYINQLPEQEKLLSDAEKSLTDTNNLEEIVGNYRKIGWIVEKKDDGSYDIRAPSTDETFEFVYGKNREDILVGTELSTDFMGLGTIGRSLQYLFTRDSSIKESHIQELKRSALDIKASSTTGHGVLETIGQSPAVQEGVMFLGMEIGTPLVFSGLSATASRTAGLIYKTGGRAKGLSSSVETFFKASPKISNALGSATRVGGDVLSAGKTLAKETGSSFAKVASTKAGGIVLLGQTYTILEAPKLAETYINRPQDFGAALGKSVGGWTIGGLAISEGMRNWYHSTPMPRRPTNPKNIYGSQNRIGQWVEDQAYIKSLKPQNYDQALSDSIYNGSMMPLRYKVSRKLDSISMSIDKKLINPFRYDINFSKGELIKPKTGSVKEVPAQFKLTDMRRSNTYYATHGKYAGEVTSPGLGIDYVPRTEWQLGDVIYSGEIARGISTPTIELMKIENMQVEMLGASGGRPFARIAMSSNKGKIQFQGNALLYKMQGKDVIVGYHGTVYKVEKQTKSLFEAPSKEVFTTTYETGYEIPVNTNNANFIDTKYTFTKKLEGQNVTFNRNISKWAEYKNIDLRPTVPNNKILRPVGKTTGAVYVTETGDMTNIIEIGNFIDERGIKRIIDPSVEKTTFSDFLGVSESSPSSDLTFSKGKSIIKFNTESNFNLDIRGIARRFKKTTTQDYTLFRGKGELIDLSSGKLEMTPMKKGTLKSDIVEKKTYKINSDDVKLEPTPGDINIEGETITLTDKTLQKVDQTIAQGKIYSASPNIGKTLNITEMEWYQKPLTEINWETEMTRTGRRQGAAWYGGNNQPYEEYIEPISKHWLDTAPVGITRTITKQKLGTQSLLENDIINKYGIGNLSITNTGIDIHRDMSIMPIIDYSSEIRTDLNVGQRTDKDMGYEQVPIVQPITDTKTINMPPYVFTGLNLGYDLRYTSINHPYEPEKSKTTKTKIPWLLPGTKDEKTKKKRKKKIKYIGGYNVFVKERSMYHGKVTKGTHFRKINRQPLTQMEALGLGGTIADETSAISFKIKPTTQKAVKSTKLIKPFENIQHKFTKKGEVWIEEPEYRMDTSGELRGISRLGWNTNRLKGLRTELLGAKKNTQFLGDNKNKNKKGGKRVRYI